MAVLYNKKKNNNNNNGPLSDFWRNVDDVIDDFMCKRMGNGEVFYGQRRSNPSQRPNTTGQYNGMGVSDKARIEERRLLRELRMEKLQRKQDAEVDGNK